jgi:hypothetical protein
MKTGLLIRGLGFYFGLYDLFLGLFFRTQISASRALVLDLYLDLGFLQGECDNFNFNAIYSMFEQISNKFLITSTMFL